MMRHIVLLLSLNTLVAGCGRGVPRDEKGNDDPNEGEIRLLAFNGDGTRLASADKGGTVAIRDGMSCRVLSWFRPNMYVRDMVFIDDGNKILTISNFRDLRFEEWNIAGGAPIRQYRKEYAHESALAVNSAGSVVAIAFSHNERGGVLLDLVGGKETPFDFAVKGQPLCISFSPDGKYLAEGVWTMRDEGCFILRNGVTGEKVWIFPDAAKGNKTSPYIYRRPTAVAFSRDGRLVAAGSEYAIDIWESHTGKLVQRLPGREASVRALAFHPDGKRLAVLPVGGGNVLLWDIEKNKCEYACKGVQEGVSSIAISRDGSYMVRGASNDGHVSAIHMASIPQ